VGPYWCRNPRKQASNPGKACFAELYFSKPQVLDNPAMKQGVLLEQESKEAGLVSPSNPQRSASSNKPQISGERRRCKADKQAAASLPKKHAVSLISKPQRSRLGSHSKADKQAAVSLIKQACSKPDQ